MLIPLSEPSNFRYIRINPATNHVHLLVPIISGLDISTDNTCKSELELKAFFEGGAVNELESYKNTLEFHLSLLEEGDARCLAKKERLAQINMYLNAVMGMRGNYKSVVNTVLANPSNLYSIQLRPRIQDPDSVVVNPAFTINRGNDFLGTPLSPLYNKMHSTFPTASIAYNPRAALTLAVLTALSAEKYGLVTLSVHPELMTSEDLQELLGAKCAYAIWNGVLYSIDEHMNWEALPLKSGDSASLEALFPRTPGEVHEASAAQLAQLKALTGHVSVAHIQDLLSTQFKRLFDVEVDFSQAAFKDNPSSTKITLHPLDKAFIDEKMGYSDEATPEEYIEALLGYCAESMWPFIKISPFYKERKELNTKGLTAAQIQAQQAEENATKAEQLSLATQFFLGVLNVYCRAKAISDKNFGKILDNSPALSQALVHLVADALKDGNDVEPALIAFFNAHKEAFHLSRDLTPEDKDAIQQKFETTYRTVTATKENPHMDDFILLDTEARGKDDIFITSNGLICTDFSHIAPITPQTQDTLAAIRDETRARQDTVMLQDEPITTVEIAPETLMDKLSDVQWDRLPKEVVDACHALPAFKVRALLDNVAKGKQDEANTILQSAEDKQALLRTPGKFTDYSGRTFRCTAYEYAYWAKDTHMQRMLERHMDDDTKALMLGKVNEIEGSGLAYQQHGLSYKNVHYDMSFILKDLNLDEFHRLKMMLGQRHHKLNTATEENYKTVSFTATEYEQLKKALAEQKWRRFIPTGSASFQLLCYLTYPVFFITSLFIPSPAKKLRNKLKFDFHSLITALHTYVTKYNKWSFQERYMAWLSVGIAQRYVVAHFAHQYCNLHQSFAPVPSFNEVTLHRGLTFDNNVTSNSSWFPLSSSSSGLGFDFAVRGRLSRWDVPTAVGAGHVVSRDSAIVDLAAITHLDKVRTDDLKVSREHLSSPASPPGLSP